MLSITEVVFQPPHSILPDMPETDLEIVPASHAARSEAFQWVFCDLDQADRTQFVARLPGGRAGGPVSCDGLFKARQGAEVVGAVWAQAMPGGVAIIWPPGVATDQPPATRLALIAAAVDFIEQQHVTMVLVLIDPTDEVQTDPLKLAGFSHLADLLYLMSLDADFPTSIPSSQMRFRPIAEMPITEISDEYLQQLIEQTYTGTQDCPQLCGTRNLDDVLEGYRATGEYDPRRWWIVSEGDQDVGCLLMADHPEAEQWELVYMGLVPAARGGGRGLQVVQYAQWQARLAGSPRLVLAVDAENAPALAMYAAAGFYSWEKKRVFWRHFST